MKGKWEDAVLDRERHEPNMQTGQPLRIHQGAPEQTRLVRGAPQRSPGTAAQTLARGTCIPADACRWLSGGGGDSDL